MKSLKTNKKGFDIGGTIQKVILGVVLMTAVAALITPFATAGNTINATGYTGSGLFASDSILPMLLIFGVLLAVVAAFMLKKYKK